MSEHPSAQTRGKLYTPQLLGLATELARYPLSSHFTTRGQARSKTCGSAVTLGLAQNDEGLVESIGIQASACAIGQAACAIFAKNAQGHSANDVARVLSEIENWLTGVGTLPNWLSIGALEPVIEHSSRHGAVILPWQAALQALSKAKEPS